MRTIRTGGALLCALTLALTACESPTSDVDPPETGLNIAVSFDGELSQTVDGGMVRIRGAASRNVSINPGQTLTIDLAAGTYTVALEALSGGDVLRFGARQNVVVTEGAVTDVSLSLSSFVPAFTDVPSEVQAGSAFTLDWSSVAGAESYEVEASASPGFNSVIRTETATTNSISLTVAQAGTFYFRVRAINAFGSEGVASEPTSPILFLSACETSEDLFLGTTVTGSLTTSDCAVEVLGQVRFLDFYSINLEQAAAAGFVQRSNNPFLIAFTADGRTAGFASVEGMNQEVPFNIFLPSGNTTFAVSGSTGGTVGDYELEAAQRGDWMQNCEVWWLSLPEDVNWTLPADISSSDCEFGGDFEGIFFDPVSVWLETGQTIRILMSSEEVDSYLEVYDPAGNLVAGDDETDDAGGGLNSLITYTATTTGRHDILAETFGTQDFGDYLLQVTDNPSGAPPAAVPPALARPGLSASVPVGAAPAVELSSVPALLRSGRWESRGPRITPERSAKVRGGDR